MSKEKNQNKVIIGLLIFIILILSVLVVLFATNTITLNTGNNDVDINDNSQENVESNTQNENKTIEKRILNNLYEIIGIPSENRPYGNSTLSYYISNNNYKEDAAKIISNYGNTWNDKSLFYTDDNLNTNEDLCPYGDLHCMFITKENANKILKLYNFTENINTYFNSSSNQNNVYSLYVTNASAESKWMGVDTGVEHDTTSEYVNSTDIRIIDKQVVSYYEDSSLVKINQTVTFDFKQDSDGNYYLYSVDVQK